MLPSAPMRRTSGTSPLSTTVPVASAAGASGGSGREGLLAVVDAGVPGVFGAVSRLITVPREWEQSLEAALGEELETIVIAREELVSDVSRVADAVGARVTLLPVDRAKPAPKLPPQASSAAEAVACEDAVRPAIDAGGVAGTGRIDPGTSLRT